MEIQEICHPGLYYVFPYNFGFQPQNPILNKKPVKIGQSGSKYAIIDLKFAFFLPKGTKKTGL